MVVWSSYVHRRQITYSTCVFPDKDDTRCRKYDNRELIQLLLLLPTIGTSQYDDGS